MIGYILFRAGKNEDAKKVLIDGRGSGTGPMFLHFDALLAAIAAKMGNPYPASRVFAETVPGIRAEDQLLLLDIAVGSSSRLIADLVRHPLSNNYRWLVSEPSLKRFRNEASFRMTLQDLYRQWQKDLSEIGPRLPAQPPQLPTPDEFLRDQARGD